MTRIRYKKNGDKLVSIQNFDLGGQVAVVEINGQEFQIVTTTGNILVKEIVKGNPKTAAKEALKNMGVTFDQEIRRHYYNDN